VDRSGVKEARDLSERGTSERGTSERGTSERGLAERAALITFLAAEAVALVVYVVISRPMWFYLDEWDFLADRTAFDVGDLFRAHNEHWVTLPVLAYRGLWWVFGLNSYRPYQLVIILLHLLAAFLVRAVMRRVGVRPWTATAAASVLVFFGSGYQNIVLPFQMTLVGALVFGLAYMLLATHAGPFDRRDAFGLLAGLAAIMCSGVGVSMIIAVGLAVLLMRGWRLALVHTMPFATLYVIWYAWVGHVGYDGYHAGPGQVVAFVRTFVATTFGAIGHYRGMGIVLGVLLVAGLVVAWSPMSRRELQQRAAIPAALLVAALALLCITGFGRAGLSSFREKSRYLHLIAALILPAVAVAADALMRRWRALTIVVVLVLVAGIPANVNVIVDYMHRGIVENQTAYKQMMLSLPRVPTARRVPRDVKPDQFLAHFVTIGWLLDGVASGRIPEPAPLTPAEAAMADLRLSFRQTTGATGPDDRCVKVTSHDVWRLEPGQRILIRAPSGSVRVLPSEEGVFTTTPFHIVTVVGSSVVAVRPVEFRLTVDVPGVLYAQVCADKRIVLATKIRSG
jgi:hypothetical protein